MKRFFCISALFLCAACANDLGNYDYRDLTEPDITGIEANISVLTHARLQLTPVRVPKPIRRPMACGRTTKRIST